MVVMAGIMIWLIEVMATALLVYQLLPVIACHLISRLAAARIMTVNKERESKSARLWRLFPASWRINLDKWLKRAGYLAESASDIYLWLVILPVPAVFVFCAMTGLPLGRLVWIAFIMISLINSRISRKVKTRRKIFTMSLFKIYRFLDLQINSGIKVTDALRGLPEAVRDPDVKSCLIRFAAQYELTLNLERAMEEIRQSFSGPDSELLATHLRQCLQTGLAGRSLIRMEELLFNRHFNLMQQDTKRIRTELLLTAMLGMAPGIIIFLYPLLYQALTSMNAIFG
jgi:Flp pilus assembly protein TadB